MMNTYDDFWARAIRHLYEDSPGARLNAIEQAGLLPLQVEYAQQGIRDRYHAGVPVMRDDGARQVLPLTVARLDAYVRLYSEGKGVEEFVLTPPGELEGWLR